MTDQTAKEISSVILGLLKQHDFTCIGTFALPEYGPDQEFDKYNEDYKYTDTETGFNDLARAAMREGDATAGLYNLTARAIEFFESSLALPDKFQNTLSEFGVANNEVPLLLSSINEESINIAQVLENENSVRLITMLKMIRDNIDLPDEDFFRFFDQIN
jgi:hypothetical protein